MLLALLACKAPTPTPEPEVPLEEQLTAPGPYGVGYQETEVTYDAAGSRTLRTAVWYPTDDSPGPGTLRYLDLFEAPDVVLDATPRPGSYPVIAYSHGHQGYAEASGRVVSHLVSHGYVVVAPDHTGNTTFDPAERDTAIYWQRATDIGAALDAVLAPDHVLADIVDADAPIVGIGHSFGGYTMHALGGASYAVDTLVQACADGDTQDFCNDLSAANEAMFRGGLRDERIDAIAPMAPGNVDLWGDDGLADIQVPVLLITGGRDNVALAQTHWDVLKDGDATHLHIEDAGHNASADVSGVTLFEGSAPDYAEPLIDPEEGWRVIGAYLLGFVRQQQGDSAVQPLFTGDVVIGATSSVE